MSDQEKVDSNSFRKRDRPVSWFNKAEKKEKINNMKNNNSNSMNGMHNTNRRILPNTILLSRAHQIHIGDPHGKVSVRQSNIQLSCYKCHGNSVRQGWDVLYWIVIILYWCCNKLQPTTRNRWSCASVDIVK